MAERLETRTFHSASAVLDQRSGPEQEEVGRIQNKLEEFLSLPEARETAMQIYYLALDVDEEIDAILRDPFASKLYEYDGRFFNRRNTSLFQTAFDGLHILKWLDDSILESVFGGRKKQFAVGWLQEELDRLKWLAQRRRIDWEECGTLNLIPPELLDEIVQDMRGRRGQGAEDRLSFSPEEKAFFKSFEEQMRTECEAG